MMTLGRSARHRALTACVFIGGLIAGCAQANSIEIPFVKAPHVQVDVYDRADGAALPVYAKGGRHYIVGEPGHEYAVRIRNCTDGRLLAVTSVDGVNVVSGETASPTQSGYVLDPWGSVEIAGWRKSLERTAAFYFTDLADSYAARTGRPGNVGVIGVAVYLEKARAPAPGFESDVARNSAPSPSARSADKLGTGHGRIEGSQAVAVAFERSSDAPAEIVSIQYDRRENLQAMRVLPRPIVASDPRPDPFPGALRFAPDP